MNCQEFELTIVDLGSDHSMEAGTRARALKHAETCTTCAARLNRERRITSGLEEFAAEETTINAPERVRLALRAAFDERHSPSASPPILRPSASSSFTSNKWLWAMAAAAMLLFSGITTALWMRGQKVNVGEAPPVSTAATGSRSTAGKPPDGGPGVQRASEIPSSPSLAARLSGRHNRRRTPPMPPVKESAGESSELFPLTFVAKSGPTEFTQTVRVEISRSTLLSMGLPINVDRGEGPIKADIIIGEDGVARAVRIFN